MTVLVRTSVNVLLVVVSFLMENILETTVTRYACSMNLLICMPFLHAMLFPFFLLSLCRTAVYLPLIRLNSAIEDKFHRLALNC